MSIHLFSVARQNAKIIIIITVIKLHKYTTTTDHNNDNDNNFNNYINNSKSDFSNDDITKMIITKIK